MRKKIMLEGPQLRMWALWMLSSFYSLILYDPAPINNYYWFHTIIVLTLVFFAFLFLYRNAIIYHMVFVLTILIYYFFTQLGMCSVYYIIDNSITDQFGGSGDFYLHDKFYLKNLSMILLGLMSTILGAILVPRSRSNMKLILKADKNNLIEDRIISSIGIVFLLLSAIYFSYYVASGRIYFGMDYSLYRSSGAIEGIYEWIIVFYMIGSCFVYSSAEGGKLWFGVMLFVFTGLILLAFGNRGEVLYPVLACFGVDIIKKKRIPIKLILVAAVIVFFLIPFIKIVRHIGTMSLDDAINTVNPWSGLAEMGVSMRMTTYIMTELESGERKFLFGFSYINPIVNILDHLVPGSIRLTPPDSFNFTNDFFAMKSMTTVAESYANFGPIGVFLHHVLMGYVMTSLESRDYSKARLALTASVGSVFIYSVRARIQSVPIEIFVCLIIYIGVKILSKIMKVQTTNVFTNRRRT